MTSFFDSHCHIQNIGMEPSGNTTKIWQKLGLSQDEVIDRAKEAGVNELMVVGCDLEESRWAIELAEKHQKIYASVGIHPHEADKYVGQNKLLDEFSDLAAHKEVKAIGECGLDYFYLHSTKENQIEILKFQIALAQKLDLPLIFHVRNAYDDFWPIFDEAAKKKPIQGVLHSYTDTIANLKMANERGLFIGVNGIATFTNDPEQQSMYKAVSADKLILETDSPYLTPAPIRGNINEPKNVVLVAEFLAKLRGDTLDNLAAVTTNNSRQLFQIR